MFMPRLETTRPQAAMPADAPSAPAPRRAPLACPLCGGCVRRTPRRWIDRLAGLFVSQRRYRCQDFGCHWQGNLRRRSSGGPDPTPGHRYRGEALGTPQLGPVDAQGRLPR